MAKLFGKPKINTAIQSALEEFEDDPPSNRPTAIYVKLAGGKSLPSEPGKSENVYHVKFGIDKQVCETDKLVSFDGEAAWETYAELEVKSPLDVLNVKMFVNSVAFETLHVPVWDLPDKQCEAYRVPLPSKPKSLVSNENSEDDACAVMMQAYISKMLPFRQSEEQEYDELVAAFVKKFKGTSDVVLVSSQRLALGSQRKSRMPVDAGGQSAS